MWANLKQVSMRWARNTQASLVPTSLTGCGELRGPEHRERERDVVMSAASVVQEGHPTKIVTMGRGVQPLGP